jgi:ssDNA-binding replication factor A large subunit
MGRTIPSYRIASEVEIRKWRSFRKALDKRDRKKFDEVLSIPRFYNVAATMACKPVLINVILMSIIFE